LTWNEAKVKRNFIISLFFLGFPLTLNIRVFENVINTNNCFAEGNCANYFKCSGQDFDPGFHRRSLSPAA